MLRTKRLSIVSTLDMTHHPDGQPLPVYSLDAAAELFPFSYTAQDIPDLARFVERQMPDPDRKVDAWASRVASQARQQTDPEGAGSDDARNQEGVPLSCTRTRKARRRLSRQLALGSGTCRDFAVLMMEALRSFGSPRASSPAICTTIPQARPGAAAARMPGAASICPVQAGSNTTRRTV